MIVFVFIFPQLFIQLSISISYEVLQKQSVKFSFLNIL